MITLQYDFGVVGLRSVLSAFDSIDRRAARSSRAQEQLARRTAAKRAAAVTGRTSAGAPSGVARGFSELARVGETLARREWRARESLAARAHTARMRQIAAEQRASERVRRATLGGIASRVGQSVASVGSAAVAASGIGGAAIVASRVAPALDLERRQRQVIVNARGAGEQSAFSYEGLSAKIRETAIGSGVSLDDVTSGVERFVQKTGDIQTAVANMQNFATVAISTGASLEDVASSAADMATQFGITDPKGMADALSVLTFQGKKGAFELRDLAENMPEMSAAAARVGLSGNQGVRKLGAFAQLARRSTGSGAEASTAVQMMFTQLIADSDKIQSGEAFGGGPGVQVFEGGDPSKAMRPVDEVIADIIAASGGNSQQLQKIFDIRGSRAVSQSMTTFSAARDAALAGGASEDEAVAAGRSAIVTQISQFAAAPGSFSDVERDASDVMRATSVQFEILNTELTAAVQSGFLPELARVAPHLRGLAPQIGQFAGKILGFVAENPFAGLGAVIATKVAADLAMAGIGTLLRTFFVETLAAAAVGARGGAAAAAIGGGLSGAGGALATAGGALAGGARGALAGAAGSLGVLGGAAAVAGAGYLAVDQAQKLTAETGGMGVGGMLAALFSGENPLEVMKQREDAAAKEEAKRAEQLRRSAEALEEAARAMKAGAPPSGSGSGVAPNRSAEPTANRGGS